MLGRGKKTTFKEKRRNLFENKNRSHAGGCRLRIIHYLFLLFFWGFTKQHNWRFLPPKLGFVPFEMYNNFRIK